MNAGIERKGTMRLDEPTRSADLGGGEIGTGDLDGRVAAVFGWSGGVLAIGAAVELTCPFTVGDPR